MIYEYVLNHKGTTKAEVIRYMDGRASLATTHKIIKEFVDNEKFFVKIDLNNSQIHHLYINDANDFNRINKLLSRLEFLGGVLYKTLLKLSELIGKRRDNDTNERPNKDNLDAPLSARDLIHLTADLGFFVDAVKKMLDNLLVQTNNLIHSEKDSQMFYTRICKIKVKMMCHEEGKIDPIELIDNLQVFFQIQKTEKEKMPSLIIEKDLISCAIKEGIIEADIVSQLRSINKSFSESFGSK